MQNTQDKRLFLPRDNMFATYTKDSKTPIKPLAPSSTGFFTAKELYEQRVLRRLNTAC